MFDNEYKERAYQWYKNVAEKSGAPSYRELSCVSVILDESDCKLRCEFNRRLNSEKDTIDKIRADAHKSYDEYWNCFNHGCGSCLASDFDEDCSTAWALSLIDRTIKVMENKND